MSFHTGDILAVCFPLLTALVLAGLYNFRTEDYFSREELPLTTEKLEPYGITARDLMKIFLVYTASALALGTAQAVLFGRAPGDGSVLFSSRFTGYPPYPFFPSFVMAMFVLWFTVVFTAARRGRDAVRALALRSYDGWAFAREMPRFRVYVLAAGLVCTGVNLWLDNIYVMVTEDSFIYNDQRGLSPTVIPLGHIDHYEVVETVGGSSGSAETIYTLRLWLSDGTRFRTETFLLHHRGILHDIDDIIRASGRGHNIGVVLSREDFRK